MVPQRTYTNHTKLRCDYWQQYGMSWFDAGQCPLVQFILQRGLAVSQLCAVWWQCARIWHGTSYNKLSAPRLWNLSTPRLHLSTCLMQARPLAWYKTYSNIAKSTTDLRVESVTSMKTSDLNSATLVLGTSVCQISLTRSTKAELQAAIVGSRLFWSKVL